MKRCGFTMVELVIVLTVTAVMVPLVYELALRFERSQEVALWHLQVADQVGSLAEELRLDGRMGPADEGAIAWQRVDCRVDYRLNEGTVLRSADEACGGTRALATGVSSLQRVSGGVRLVFEHPDRPDHAFSSPVFIPVEGL